MRGPAFGGGASGPTLRGSGLVVVSPPADGAGWGVVGHSAECTSKAVHLDPSMTHVPTPKQMGRYGIREACGLNPELGPKRRLKSHRSSMTSSRNRCPGALLFRTRKLNCTALHCTALHKHHVTSIWRCTGWRGGVKGGGVKFVN